MSHIHWVERQNKLEIPRDKDEVNKREIRESDGRASARSRHDGSPTDRFCFMTPFIEVNKKKNEFFLLFI